LTATPRTSSLPDTQKTKYDKRKMKNEKTYVMNFLAETTPESQQLIKEQ